MTKLIDTYGRGAAGNDKVLRNTISRGVMVGKRESNEAFISIVRLE